MKLFEENLSKKIKAIAIILFVIAIAFALIYIYQCVISVFNIYALEQDGFTISLSTTYFLPILSGLASRIVLILLPFPIYGLGKLLEYYEQKIDNQITE